MDFCCSKCGYEFTEAVYHPLAGDAVCCPICGAADVAPEEFDGQAERESEVQTMTRNPAFEACKSLQAHYWWNGWLVGAACGVGLAVTLYHLTWWIGQVWELGL